VGQKRPITMPKRGHLGVEMRLLVHDWRCACVRVRACGRGWVGVYTTQVPPSPFTHIHMNQDPHHTLLLTPARACPPAHPIPTHTVSGGTDRRGTPYYNICVHPTLPHPSRERHRERHRDARGAREGRKSVKRGLV